MTAVGGAGSSAAGSSGAGSGAAGSGAERLSGPWSARFLDRLQAVGVLRPEQLTQSLQSAQPLPAVSALTVIAGSVDARASDADGRSYDVWVELPVLDGRQWARAEQALAAHDGVREALLDGEAPELMLGVLARAGLSLFPVRAEELTLECSCPQWARCPHVVAVLLALAAAFDADPFLLPTWRGRGRAGLQRHLGDLRAAALAERPVEQLAREDPRPLSERIGDFWAEGGQRRALAAREPVAAPGSPGSGPAPAHLGASGIVIRGRSLETLLQPGYEALSD